MARKEQVAFLIEKSQKEVIDELTNEEAGIIFKAIFEYEVTKKEPKLEKTLKLVFKQFKGKLDSYDNAYESKCLKNKENIDNYWKSIKGDTNEYDRIRMNTTATNKNKKKENKINKNKIKEREIYKERENANAFLVANATTHTPTINQIIDYGETLGIEKEYCERFYNYYESIGWVTGTGQDIKNWKLVFKNWVAKDNKDIPEWFGQKYRTEKTTSEDEKFLKDMISRFVESEDGQDG